MGGTYLRGLLRVVVGTSGAFALLLALPPLTALAQDATSPEGEPRGGWADGAFLLESSDGEYRLTIGGRVQPRYQFRSPPDREDTSSFFLRRIRIDLRGQVFDERLTFRVMPEMAREANLRDGWLDFAFHPGLQLRAGQFVVPYHWHRFLSGNRQFFAERSEPSETFGFPNGYDVGVALHGRNETNTLAYGAGVFDGAGRNVRESNSVGHMASARVTWAPRGELPAEEPDLAGSEAAQVSVGVGLQAANRNEVRPWDLGRSAIGNARANWAAGTMDLSVRRSGLSVVAEGHARRVVPDDPALEAYTGWAHLLGAGAFVVPGRYEVVGRWSRLALDGDDPATRQRQLGAGVNVYHRGHLWKTHVQAFRTTTQGGSEEVLLIQLHLQF